MGLVSIQTGGSFPLRSATWDASDHGHAHVVAQAIEWLAAEVLPDAIEQDHKLHAAGLEPRLGFDRPTDNVVR